LFLLQGDYFDKAQYQKYCKADSRLFHASFGSGEFEIQERENISQGDVITLQEDCLIVDAYCEVTPFLSGFNFFNQSFILQFFFRSSSFGTDPAQANTSAVLSPKLPKTIVTKRKGNESKDDSEGMSRVK